MEEEIEKQFQEAISVIERPSVSELPLSHALSSLQELCEQDGHAESCVRYGELLMQGNLVDADQSYAVDLFQRAALAGHSSAHFEVGVAFMLGLGNLTQDIAKGLVHYAVAAKGDHHLALLSLGFRYHFGINVPASCEQAVFYLENIAFRVKDSIIGGQVPLGRIFSDVNQGWNLEASDSNAVLERQQLLTFLSEDDNPDILYQLGMLYLHGLQDMPVDVDLAKKFLLRAAAFPRKAVALYWLGYICEMGLDGLPPNYELAADYYNQLVQRQNVMGNVGLGRLLFHRHMPGRSHPEDAFKDYQEAMIHFNAAAAASNAEAHFYLGMMHLSGLGIPVNAATASKHFDESVKATNSHEIFHPFAPSLVMSAYLQLRGLGIAKNCNNALNIYDSIASRWHAGLENRSLAVDHYDNGHPQAALYHFERYAEAGYAGAMRTAAMLRLEAGESDRALAWYLRAGDLGDADALVKAGDLVSADDQTLAMSLYRKAAGKNVAVAAFNLGTAHLGLWGNSTVDVFLAKRFLDQAVSYDIDAAFPVCLAMWVVFLLYVKQYLQRPDIIVWVGLSLMLLCLCILRVSRHLWKHRHQ